MYDMVVWIENKSACILMTIRSVDNVDKTLASMPAIKKVVSVTDHVSTTTHEMVTCGGMFGCD